MRRYFRVAFALARLQTGNAADAEDVCQIAFTQAYEKLHECRDPDRFAGWLLRIVRTRAINYRQREHVRRSEPLDAAESRTSASGPEADLDRARLRATLERALSRLKPVQRDAVLLHDLEDWKHADIADALGISEFMSRRHVSDGRMLLRTFLNAEREDRT